MGRERMINEDVQAMGKRAKSVACAFKRSRPKQGATDFEVSLGLYHKAQWETDVLSVLTEFERTNKYFPTKHFLKLCGFEGAKHA